MKNLLIVLIALLLAGCNTNVPEGNINNNIENEEKQEVVNVITTVDTLDEFKTALGFELVVPEQISGVTEKTINVFETLKMAEVVFPEKAVIRKIAKENLITDSLSGVYLNFDEPKNIDGYKLLSSDGYVYVCEWEKDGFAYSLNMLDGVSEEKILEVAKQIS